MFRGSFLLGLAALAACAGGESSRVEDVDPALKQRELVVPPVPDRFPYGDLRRTQVGDWVRVSEGPRTLTLQAVRKEARGLWVEVIDEGDPRQVSAQLVAEEGTVLAAFYGELSGSERSPVRPQALEQTSGGSGPRLTETERQIDQESVTVGEHLLQCRRVRVCLEDLEGHRILETTLWHPDVPPLYASSDAGGLVRKRSPKRSVDLLAYGRDAQPLLSLPR
jgi:hypothetical protein